MLHRVQVCQLHSGLNSSSQGLFMLLGTVHHLLCAHTFIHCLLFAAGSVLCVNGGWTPESVPEDAELVATGSSNHESP